MPETETPLLLPEIHEESSTKSKDAQAPAFLVIVWNDPVNTTVFVTHVFQKVFGWNRKKAEFHMLEVDHNGKSVVARESQERAEAYVHQLQAYSLHVTMEPDK